MAGRLERRPGDLPLYAQIADLLRSRIVGSGMRPGDRLESEPELARDLGVSRATVAKALELLIRDGLVARQQGRGTFVTRSPLDRRLPELTSFSEHVAGLGLVAGQRFVDYRRTGIGPGEADPLLAAFAVGLAVVVARRIRLVNGLPAGLHRTVVPAAIADTIGFTEDALRGEQVSLYALFETHGIALARAEEHLQACNASPDDAALLDIEPGQALMHVRRLSRETSGQLVEAVDARYIGALYDYRVELVRSAATGLPQPGTKEQGDDTLAHLDAGGGTVASRRGLR